MSRLRVVSYTINGRGMGHLVRQLAILRWVRRISALLDVKCECWVLTSSEADTLARREGVPAFKLPSKAMMRDAGIEPARYLAVARTWVLNAIAGLAPDLLLVDTFPGGSFGELVAALEIVPHRVLVARRVRDEFASEDAYRALLPLYERHIAPDERGTGPILIRERAELLDRGAARHALGIAGDRRAVYVTLGGGGDVACAATIPSLSETLRARGWHVVVGAGPLYQGPELRGDGITWIDRYVPMELFPGLDAAVSAGGYNAFHELMFAGVPTVFLPQPRIADDQEERVRRAEAAGAGRVAASIDEVPALLEAPGDPAAARALVPVNGARAAAVAALATVLPERDLAMAARVLTPELFDAMQDWTARDPTALLSLLRVLVGRTPSEQARRRAVLLELADEGESRGVDRVDGAAADAVTDGDDNGGDSAAARVRTFTAATRACQVPIDSALALVRGLRRKFPAASAGELVSACDVLFQAWAPFQDWMGAISLIRAVPTQRGYRLTAFAHDVAAWLAAEDDLFDALRAFTRLENGGARTVAECLRVLRASAQASGAGGSPREEAL